MSAFEKLGVFYLGKTVDPKTAKAQNEYLLYDSKDLTTHAVCVGMTGSGKTGLGIGILEEGAIDKIPAIIIDPKGDLTNLLLTFPDLAPEEFKPWIDDAEAARKNQTVDQYAESIAKTWKDGLASWDETAERIRMLKQSVDMVIYTPASTMGVPLSILNSFTAPSNEEINDPGIIRDKIQSITSSLLGLLGILADPIKSREHILISSIIDEAWRRGKDVDIPSLINQVQEPAFTKIGALDIDTFYPQKDRLDLAIKLNNLLASPGFQAWMQGEPLDIKRLLHTPEGKPKLSIISIAHLSDAERMFFVTLLLNTFISWMRQQPGTTVLRAILYMDEIFGYFPPTSMPPSKLPMLTLLKQARAFGVGIVLVTQNPVDLDYKGLSNCGTWFIGKLQTQRDKMRVIEGLKIASNGELDSKSLDKMISLTGNRVFIMRSIYKKDPILFQTRWTLSYLKGPLTLNQIASLTTQPAQTLKTEQKAASENSPQENKPFVPPGIAEYFASPTSAMHPIEYTPKALGMAKLHYVDTKNKIDLWESICIVQDAFEDPKEINWNEGIVFTDLKNKLENTPRPLSTFHKAPSGLLQEKNYSAFEKSLALSLYQNRALKIYKASDFNLVSNINETEGDFRARVALILREKRDEMVKKLQDKYADKINSLHEKMKKAQGNVESKQHKSFLTKIQTWISFGATIIGALLGRGITKGTITQTGTSLKRAGQISKDSRDAARAEETYIDLQQQVQDIQKQIDKETANITLDPQNIPLETIMVTPRKSDIDVEKVAILWWPK